MKDHVRKLVVTASATIGSAALMLPFAVSAAPGALSDSPLFLSNSVEPNVLFTLDDSRSVDWGLMTSEPDGIMYHNACPYWDALPAPDNNELFVVPPEQGLRDAGVAAPYGGAWRARNADYNKVYYDPTITYTPWPGVNSSGVAFPNANPRAALYNPWIPSVGAVDLTSDITFDTDWCGDLPAGTPFTMFPAMYQQWTDSNGNGDVDADDTHVRIEIRPLPLTYPGGINRRDCAAAPVCTYAEEIQNFANWFSYYRKREYVAKAAYGRVISSANNSRMGLVTLNNNASVNRAIDSMNQDPSTGNKKALLDSLYAFQSQNETPLRSQFNESGKYLSCDSNSLFGSCPAVPASSGGECQQNFNVVMTDGFYNGSFSSLGNEDGDNDTEWDSGFSGPYGDSDSNTLADIAMKYYEDDLRPGVANKVRPAPGGIDNNEQQHMVTYSVGFGVEGTIPNMPTDTTSPFAWPTPDTDARKIDDLRHAAWNGRGEYFSAQNPTELITGLREALGSIQGRIGSAAAVAFNSGSLSTNSEVYLALFNSERWSGELFAYSLDPATGDVSGTPQWRASVKLGARDLTTRPRTILTFDGAEGAPFQWDDLTAAQRDDLRTNSSGGTDAAVVGKARLGYLRGDRDCEVGSGGVCAYTDGLDFFNTKQFRERSGRLGDIVHSGPVYVGIPESNWPDTAPFPYTSGDTYTEFRQAQSTRPGMIYVGSNDGMVHGFLQSSGEEAIAYVPGEIYSNAASDGLHYLTEPGYVHRYYVDLSTSIADVHIKTSPIGSASWRTILVGGLRAGGRGIFALDVTDPTAFSEAGSAPESTVLWEFTSSDDPDLGHTFSQPSIVPLQGPTNSIRWAAVFGNGYNDQGSGEAKLFVVFLEAGLDGAWTAGDYIEISTGSGTTTNRNGLSTPAVIDTDGDGLADRVYAGDLFGEMWAFDLSGSNTGNWAVAYTQSSIPKPLFTAPAGQQITSVPVIVRNSEESTSGSNSPNTLVMFGTGQYLTAADISTTNTQTMYGIWDSGSSEIVRGDLLEQTIGYGSSADGTFGRTLTDNSINYGTHDGWYMNLPDSGERQITSPVIRGDLVFFNSMVPDSNPCNYGGTGWQMVAKWSNGGRPNETAFDFNNDGILSTADDIGGNAAVGTAIVGLPTFPVNLANKRYTATTETTGGDTIEVTDIIDIGGNRSGRLSWEELTP